MLFFLLVTVLSWLVFGFGGPTIVLGACTMYCLLQVDPDTWGRDFRARQRERRDARANPSCAQLRQEPDAFPPAPHSE